MKVEKALVIGMAFLFAYVFYDQQVENFREIRKSLISIDSNIAEISALLKEMRYVLKQVILYTLWSLNWVKYKRQKLLKQVLPIIIHFVNVELFLLSKYSTITLLSDQDGNCRHWQNPT